MAVLGHAGVLERLVDGLVGVADGHVLADEGDAAVPFRFRRLADEGVPDGVPYRRDREAEEFQDPLVQPLLAQFARERKIPFLGICLGMQCAVVEYARDVVGWKDANSTEFDENTAHPVIDLMEEQRGITQKGGTMRLGAYPCVLRRGSLAARLYGKCRMQNAECAIDAGNSRKSLGVERHALRISERHRHRYELAYDGEARKALEDAGLKVSGVSPDGRLAEVVELPGHPYFIACQFHPEFKSRPTSPHPLFTGLVAAALARRNG